MAQCSRRQQKVNEHMMHSARKCKARPIFLGTRVASPGPRHLRDVSASLLHRIDSGVQIWTSGLCSEDFGTRLIQRLNLERRSGPVASVVQILVQVSYRD